MNIYQKLQAVMREVAYVKKDKEVKAGTGGTYNAVTHDMVTAMVRQHFVTQGIIVVPRLTRGEVVDTGRKTQGGNPIIRFEGFYDISFVNADDPSDVATVPVCAHAEDQGDKAPGKALSYATKGAILKVLMLETGDDDEGRIRQDEPELDDAQTAILQSLRDEALKGIEPLKLAWAALSKEQRTPMQSFLVGLKKAAMECEKDKADAGRSARH